MRWLSRGMRNRARHFVEGHRLAGRMLTVFADDTFIVSYPKSGNTWMRFLVASLLSGGGPIDFLKMEHRIAMIYGCTNTTLLKKPRPRILSSHEYFDPRYRRVIYIVRDPRDVVISSYYHQLRLREIPDSWTMEAYVSPWLAGKVGKGGSDTWAENVMSWLALRRDDPSFLLVRYEDLHATPQQELARVASFLRLDLSPELLAQTIVNCSAERLRELEKQQREVWGMTKGSRPDIPFIGKARAGGWKDVLSESLVREIESTCGAVMKSVGFKLANEPAGGSVEQAARDASTVVPFKMSDRSRGASAERPTIASSA
jgi:hypothetical protein